MITEDGKFMVCDGHGCTEKIKNHRWGRTKAEGWLFLKDNRTCWCPKHLPAWAKRRNSDA